MTAALTQISLPVNASHVGLVRAAWHCSADDAARGLSAQIGNRFRDPRSAFRERHFVSWPLLWFSIDCRVVAVY
jgi:hypothetical protein